MMQLPVPIVKVSKGSNLCQLASALMVRAYYGESINTEQAENDILAFLPFTLGNNERHSQGTALWLAQNGYDVLFTHHDLSVLKGPHPIELGKLREQYNALKKTPPTYQTKKLSLDIQLLERGIHLSYILPGLGLLDQNLAKKIPTICIVKHSGLHPNLSDKSNHAIVIIGKQHDDYIYNDNNFDEPQRVNKSSLLQAWHASGAYTITACPKC